MPCVEGGERRAPAQKFVKHVIKLLFVIVVLFLIVESGSGNCGNHLPNFSPKHVEHVTDFADDKTRSSCC